MAEAMRENWRREKYANLAEFWPFYLNEHRNGVNRWLHYIGSTLGIGVVVSCLLTRHYAYIPLAFVCGYAFAWVGHFLIEKNRPATFIYPLMSFASDWRLWFMILTGRTRSEYAKYGIELK